MNCAAIKFINKLKLLPLLLIIFGMLTCCSKAWAQHDTARHPKICLVYKTFIKKKKQHAIDSFLTGYYFSNDTAVTSYLKARRDERLRFYLQDDKEAYYYIKKLGLPKGFYIVSKGLLIVSAVPLVLLSAGAIAIDKLSPLAGEILVADLGVVLVTGITFSIFDHLIQKNFLKGAHIYNRNHGYS